MSGAALSRRHVAVIGAGAWGIALACVQARAGANVTLWMRSPPPNSARTLPRLPEISLPDAVTVTDQFPAEADITLLAVPMQTLRTIVSTLPGTSPLIACCKGIETGTGAWPTQILQELHPDRPCGVLSGPNFAIEVARGLPAAATIAAADLAAAKAYAGLCASSDFRLYANDDTIGVQVAGAAKNVIAIGAGVTMGAALGENARAALITRATAEIARLAQALGGRPATLAGLSGVGDLILTCTGPGSRNFSLGFALGRGETLSDILHKRTTVAEGVTTAPALLTLARGHNIAMPIVETVCAVLGGDIRPSEAARMLMERPPTIE